MTDFFFTNAIATMRGEHFLWLNAVWIIIVFRITHLIINKNNLSNDKIRSFSPTLKNISIEKIAVLKKGLDGLLLITLIKLITKKRLHVDPYPRYLMVERIDFSISSTTDKLSSTEKILYDALTHAHTYDQAKEIIRPEHERIRCRLKQLKILKSQKDQNKLKNLERNGLIILNSLGFYKIICAIHSQHYNIYFLLLMLGVSSCLYHIIFNQTESELTTEGEKLLNHTAQLLNTNLTSAINHKKSGGNFDPKEAFSLIAFFGVPALVLIDNTPSQLTALYHKFYPQLIINDSNGNEDSGSSNNSSSSGCGSTGCGGCGGCGD